VDDLEWFDFDGQLADDERAFLTVLRQRTEDRLRPWCIRENPPDGPLIVGLHVDAPEVALLTIGVHLSGGRVRGDRLHNQLNTLPDQPTSLALEVTGLPADLAAHSADWFDSILCRPIVRYEWMLHSGQVYASRYAFADTGEGLVEMYNHVLAPTGQRDKLIAAGFSRGMGWIDTRGLGAPDRVIPIRGGT
jgi:hypothetical protein